MPANVKFLCADSTYCGRSIQGKEVLGKPGDNATLADFGVSNDEDFGDTVVFYFDRVVIHINKIKIYYKCKSELIIFLITKSFISPLIPQILQRDTRPTITQRSEV